MGPDLLTTGQAAKLCGVTPDTVLKWIKRERLPAARTTGGHYRIARKDLEPMRRGGTGTATTLPKHCWQYFCQDPALPEACRQCVVYRARIERCYEVANMGQTIGHKQRFCRKNCENCSFFRACNGMAPAVLVITGDEDFVAQLTRADSGSAVVRFARSGYESSMIIETFRPSTIVIDGALPEAQDGRLLDSISRDERILGARIILAQRKGSRIGPKPGVLVMHSPFSIAQIEHAVYEGPAVGKIGA